MIDGSEKRNPLVEVLNFRVRVLLKTAEFNVLKNNSQIIYNKFKREKQTVPSTQMKTKLSVQSLI